MDYTDEAAAWAEPQEKSEEQEGLLLQSVNPSRRNA